MNDRRRIQTESMAAQTNAASDICGSVLVLLAADLKSLITHTSYILGFGSALLFK